MTSDINDDIISDDIGECEIDYNCSELKIKYSKLEKIYAFICVGLGYLFIKLILAGGLGIATSIFFLIVIISTLILFNKNNIKMNVNSVIQLFILLVFNLNFALYSNFFLKFLVVIFMIVSITYWINFTCSGTKNIRKFFFFDMQKSIFTMPFKSFSECSKAIASSKSKSSKNMKLILLGISISLPLTIVIANLFLSADKMFEGIFNYFYGDLWRKIITFLLQFAFGIPIAFYIFGMFISNIKHKNSEKYNDEHCEEIIRKLKISPALIIYSAIIPICILYLMFFFSQIAYFFSAFKSILPTDFTIAEYARQGFFELCAISFINVFIIVMINFLCKADSGKKTNGLKFFSVFISISTVLLIATALSKMIMYIDELGFTLLRVYTSWFMILLLLIFILIGIKQFFNKLNLAKCVVSIFVAMFFVLNFSNVDGLIAKYNTEKKYTSGINEKLDIRMMTSLSDSAVEYVIPFLENVDKSVRLDAAYYITQIKSRHNNDFRSFNLSTYNAKKLIKEAELRLHKNFD